MSAFLAEHCTGCDHPRSAHMAIAGSSCTMCGCYAFVSPIARRDFAIESTTHVPALIAACDSNGCESRVSFAPTPDCDVRPALRAIGWFAPDGMTLQRCGKCRKDAAVEVSVPCETIAAVDERVPQRGRRL